MRSTLFIVACLLGLPPGSMAQVAPAVHLTGNRTADFFGAFQPAPTIARPGLLQEESMRPSAMEGEKSPWLAAFMSLAVPGSGEVYTGNYLKGALFFAADVAAWTVTVVYNNKGDREERDYQAFADAHWSAVRYANWTLNNLPVISPPLKDDAAQYREAIFGNNTPPDNTRPPFSAVNWPALNSMESDIGSNLPPGGNGYTHDLPYYGQQQYYELIGKYDQFSRGWDDADLNDVGIPIVRNSTEMTAYSVARAQANYSYDVASTFVSVAVINHLLSAVDAYWSATRLNATLHAEFRMRMQPTPYGLLPVSEADFRLNF